MSQTSYFASGSLEYSFADTAKTGRWTTSVLSTTSLRPRPLSIKEQTVFEENCAARSLMCLKLCSSENAIEQKRIKAAAESGHNLVHYFVAPSGKVRTVYYKTENMDPNTAYKVIQARIRKGKAQFKRQNELDNDDKNYVQQLPAVGVVVTPEIIISGKHYLRRYKRKLSKKQQKKRSVKSKRKHGQRSKPTEQKCKAIRNGQLLRILRQKIINLTASRTNKSQFYNENHNVTTATKISFKNVLNKFKANYDRATAKGKTDPGPTTVEELKQLRDKLRNVKRYEDIIEIRKDLLHTVSSKLRLTPSADINAKLTHFDSVLTLAIDKGDSLLGVEGITDLPVKTDFDILYRAADDLITAVDVTHDPSLYQAKAKKINIQARRIREELEENDIITNTTGLVHLPLESTDFDVDLTQDPVSRWDQSYEIIDSINEKNFEEAKESARRFLDAYENKLDIANEVEPDPSLNIDPSFAIRIAYATQRNDKLAIDTFKSLGNVNEPFIQRCIETAGKLAHMYNSSKVRSWELKYNVCCAKPSSNSFIPQSLLANPILNALQRIKDLNDKESYYAATISQTIKTAKPKDVFATGNTILIAKYQGNADFIIHFNPEYIDDNLVDAIHRKHKPTFAATSSLSNEYFLKDVNRTDEISTPEEEDDSILEDLSASNVNITTTSIIRKLVSIIESNNRLNVKNVDGILSESVHQLLANYQNMPIFNVLEHEYEVAKSFAVTLGYPKKSHSYRICFNGNYNSITIRQNNAPLDSFTNAFYFVIYEEEESFPKGLIRTPHSMVNNIVQTKSLSFNRNTLSWELRKIYTVIMLSSWLIENKSKAANDFSEMTRLTVTAYRICTVNRNAFAVASEQTRYLYVSATGRNSNPIKIIDKLDNYSPRNRFEITYLIRMIKMSALLYLLRISGNLSQISTHDSFGNRILKVAFPHETEAVPDFNYSISAFYVCNVFNKFKYNVSTSESLCFQALLEENEIFTKAISERENEVLGLSEEVIANKAANFINIIDEYLESEINHALAVSRHKPKRFSFSLILILSIFLTRYTDVDINKDMAHKRLSLSPIDACTLRGGMQGTTITDKPQSIRAASVMIEGIVKDYGYDVDKFNKHALYQQQVIEELASVDVSTETLACNNYNKNSDYCYRIVHKDQKGEREISVLNYNMRIGAKFVEETSRAVAFNYKQNVLEDPDKSIRMAKLVEETKAWKTQDYRLIYDNNDQQRWGPNHLVVTFYALLAINMVKDSGSKAVIRSVFKRFERKKAKFPENLIDKVLKDIQYKEGTTIGNFIKTIKTKVSVGEYGVKFEWGMCQGILHVTSSLYHAAIADYIEEYLIKHKIVNNIRTLITSDDGFRAIQIPKEDDFNRQLAILGEAITKISSGCNIIRSPAKSTFNTIVAEFNSDFYVAGSLYTPNLKQRISKIEAGSGEDYIDDMCAALSSASQYFSAGGTYFGSYLLQCVNICQVTEQWRRWYQYRDVTSTDKSVLLGGLPLISPMLTLLGGPTNNIFVKDLIKGLTTAENIGRYFALIANSSAERVNQDEMLRGSTSVVKDLNFYYFQSVSLSGFVSLTRPHKQASRFERRHKLSDATLPDEYISLSSSENSFNSLILAVVTGSGSKSFEDTIGTNTYITRFAESYVNLDAKRFRVGKATVSSALVRGSRISLRDVEDFYSNTTNPYPDSATFDRLIGTDSEALTPLIKLVVDNITNAHRIALEQEGRIFYEIKTGKVPSYKICKLATNRISVIDSESFRLAVFISSYKGDSISICKNMGYRPSTLLHLPELTVEKQDSLIEAVKYTKSVVDSYAKYLKHKTKAILKALNVSRDLYEMIFNASYLNLTSLKSAKPPKVELPTSGRVIRVCRLAVRSELSTAVTNYSNQRSEDIFQSGYHYDDKSYLSTNSGESLGLFETIHANTKISSVSNDSCLLIDKHKTNQVHRKLDMLIPTSTSFRFSGRVLRNIRFSTFCENTFSRFNGMSFRSVIEAKSPLRIADHVTIGYVIRRYKNNYRHIIYVTPNSDATSETVVNAEIVNINRHLYTNLKNYFGLFSVLRVGFIYNFTEQDTLQVVLLTAETKCSLAYSTDSMVVAIEARNSHIPYTTLPMNSIDQFHPKEPIAINRASFSAIRRYIETLFRGIDDALEDEAGTDLRMEIAHLINKLQLPLIMDNFVDFLNALEERFEDIVETSDSIRHTIIGNSTTFIFMLITQFKAYYNYRSSLTRNLRKNNFTKGSDEKMFEPRQQLSALVEVIPFAEQENEVEQSIQATATAADSILNLVFDDDDVDGEDFLFDTLDEDTEPESRSVAFDLGIDIGSDAAPTLVTAEPVIEVAESLLTGSIFEVYEAGEDDLEDVELHDSRTWSVYDNLSDKNYKNNARAMLKSMVPEARNIFRDIRNPATLVNKVLNMHGGDRKLSELYATMSKYMPLDRLLIVFLCFEFSN